MTDRLPNRRAPDGTLARGYHWLAAQTPGLAPAPPALTDAMETSGLDLDATTYTSVIAVLAGTASVLAFGVGAVVTDSGWVVLSLGLGACALVGTGLYVLPFGLAARRRAARVGALPGFVCRTALGMRLAPSLEAGIDAAFETPDAIVRRVATRQRGSADARLTTAVADLGPAAQRAAGLLSAAATASDHERLLDRAVDTAMDGTHRASREYASGIQGPVTAIYAFGVVLPLALVGILPTAPLAGVDLSMPALALVLDGLLPLAVLSGTGWLVVHRPAIDPPPTLSPDHPALGPRSTVVTTAVIAGLAGLLVEWALGGHAGSVLPVAWSAGAGLLARYQPALPARRQARKLREALPDLLALLGETMQDGASPERALATASTVPGDAGDVAETATRIRERLGVSVAEAMIHPASPLSSLDARTSRSVAALLRTAAEAGRPGGRALTRYATHLDALHDLEADVRADLARLTGTLDQTAAIYAPAIGGLTVALATRLQTPSDPGVTTQVAALGAVSNGDALALVVGVYVLVLAVVLPAMATVVTDGWSRVRVGARVGRSLVLAGGIFPVVASLGSRLL